jgi:hypothetical protein
MRRGTSHGFSGWAAARRESSGSRRAVRTVPGRTAYGGDQRARAAGPGTIVLLGPKDSAMCQVLSDLERAPVGLAGHATVVPQVVPPVAHAPRQTGTAGVEGPLHHRRVPENGVGGGRCAGQHVDREPCPLHAVPVGPAALQLIDQSRQASRGGHIALADPPVDGVGPPGGIGEATILVRRRHLRAAAGNADQFPAQDGGLPGYRSTLAQGGRDAGDQRPERGHRHRLTPVDCQGGLFERGDRLRARPVIGGSGCGDGLGRAHDVTSSATCA